jgi:hypothetical protein
MSSASAMDAPPPKKPLENPSDVAAARELFQKGVAASKAGRWLEAREHLARALALKRAPMILYTLGVAEKNSGKMVAALEHLRAFLLAPVEPATEPFVAPAKEAVTTLESRVARATILVEPARAPGLRVTLDGEPVPAAALGQGRLVDPGKHELVAEATDHERARRAFEVGEGGRLEVRLELKALPPSAKSPTQEGGEPSEAPFPVLPVALMSAGGAAAVAGAIVGVIGIAQGNEASSKADDDFASGRDKAIAGDIVGGVGVATAALGLILLLLDDGGATEPTAAGPTLVPAGLSYRF